MIPVIIALGSNLGNRQDALDRAVDLLRASSRLHLRQVSPYYETAPVGGPADAGPYLNAVASGTTTLSPEELLQLLLKVEIQLGRVRGAPNDPRTLDLDLLLYGDLVRNQGDPIVPHPRLHERHFVLQPMCDIAPDLVHPVFGKTMRTLLDELPAIDSPPRRFPRSLEPAPRELLGKRALVTGSTSGIGLAIARELASAGATVIVHGRRSEAQARRVAELCGNDSSYILADLTQPLDCDRLMEQAWDRGLDIFIQNAGADLLTGDAPQWTFEQKWRALEAVDVAATMRLCRAIGERMRSRYDGVILTMGWDQAATGMEGDSGQLFGTAKAAVMAFTKSLALSLAPQVRVNALCPGWIKTEWGENASDRWQDRVVRETPLGRWGLPEDVAKVARWLCSPAARYVTGQCIAINGGAVRF